VQDGWEWVGRCYGERRGRRVCDRQRVMVRGGGGFRTHVRGDLHFFQEIAKMQSSKRWKREGECTREEGRAGMAMVFNIYRRDRDGGGCRGVYKFR
jgi:hypothetical protein